MAAGRGERVQRPAFKRFFDSLSRDVFEAARMDGATFLVFQRVFHRGGGMEGAVKG